jgi:hypothetical protein
VQAGIQGLRTDIWAEDAYSISDDETCVGRIYKERIHGNPMWLWFLDRRGAAAEQRRVQHAGGGQSGLQAALCRGQGRDVIVPDLTH